MSTKRIADSDKPTKVEVVAASRDEANSFNDLLIPQFILAQAGGASGRPTRTGSPDRNYA